MNIRVLIFAQDQSMSKVLETRLVKSGFRIIFLDNANQIKKQIHDVKPAVIIADADMPDNQSFKINTRLRASSASANIPFIFLGTDESNLYKGLQMGIDYYIYKPVNMTFLQKKIHTCLAAVKRAGQHPPNINGSLGQKGLNDVTGIIEILCKSGTLILKAVTGRLLGRIFFRQGRIINAECEPLEGEEAFFELMGATSGRYIFQPMKIKTEPIIQTPNVELLLKTALFAEDRVRLEVRLPNMDIGLKIKNQQVASAIERKAGVDNVLSVFWMIDEKKTATEIINCGEMSRLRAASILNDFFSTDTIIVDSAGSDKRIAPGSFSRSYGIETWLLKILNNFHQGSLTGVLEIINRNKYIAVYIDQGEIVHAAHDQTTGKKALFRILAGSGGVPKFHHQSFQVKTSIQKNFDTLLAEAANEIYTLEQLNEDVFNKKFKINPNPSAQAKLMLKAPGLKNIFAILAKHSKLKDIIEAHSMTDLETYKYLLNMVKKGILILAK